MIEHKRYCVVLVNSPSTHHAEICYDHLAECKLGEEPQFMTTLITVANQRKEMLEERFPGSVYAIGILEWKT